VGWQLVEYGDMESRHGAVSASPKYQQQFALDKKPGWDDLDMHAARGVQSLPSQQAPSRSGQVPSLDEVAGFCWLSNALGCVKGMTGWRG
jgi:hypothetical protein